MSNSFYAAVPDTLRVTDRRETSVCSEPPTRVGMLVAPQNGKYCCAVEVIQTVYTEYQLAEGVKTLLESK